MLAEPLARLLARRGLVIGLLTASSATGQLTFLLLVAWPAEHHSWRVALAPALLSCAAAAVLAVLVLRDHPADLGLLPYGEPAGAPLAYAPALTGSSVGLAFAILAEAARARMFWLLFWYYGLRGLSLLYLPFPPFTCYGLSVFALFYGLNWIATVPPAARLAGFAFGREKAPLVFGWVFTPHQRGAATAAFGAGWSRDALSTCLPAFVVAGVGCLVAAAACALTRRSAATTRAPACA